MDTINYLEIACQIVRNGIDLAKQDDPHKDYLAEIKRANEQMSQQWLSGRQPNLKYDQMVNRLAYVYGQMAANAYVVERVFSDLILKRYFETKMRENGKVTVCVFGAGPGTEIIGIAGWIRKQKFPKSSQVDFTLFDIQTNWRSSLELSLNTVRDALAPKGFVVHGTCDPKCDPKANLLNFELFDQARGHDIYIFPYILSEIMNKQKELTNFARQFSAIIPDGAKLVFIDRHSDLEDHTKSNISAIMDFIGTFPDKKIIETELPPEQWRAIYDGGLVQDLRERIDRFPRKKIKAFYAIGENVILDDIPF